MGNGDRERGMVIWNGDMEWGMGNGDLEWGMGIWNGEWGTRDGE